MKMLRSRRWFFITLHLCYISLVFERQVSAIHIDPQFSGNKHKMFTHCLESGQSLKMGDPFSAAQWTSDDFIFMMWLRVTEDGETTLAFFKQGNHSIKMDRVSKYETWGIEISPVGLNDAAIYKAQLKRQTTPLEVSFRVVVATAPKLASEKLETKFKGEGQQVLLCGEVKSRGTPPIDMEWKDQHDKTLNSSFKDGFLELKLNSSLDSDEFMCVVNDSSPAMICVPPEERDLWNAAEFVMASSTQSAGTTMTIVIAVVAVVFVLIIIVIIAFVISRKRAMAYNTKKGESMMKGSNAGDLDGQEAAPLSADTDETQAPRLPSKPTSPYQVSEINQMNVETNHYASSPVNRLAYSQAPTPAERQQKQAPVAPSEDTNVGNGEGKTGPPKPKPRSQFFGSQEQLNVDNPDSNAAKTPETCV